MWVFLGFSKNILDEHTYHFYVNSPPFPPLGAMGQASQGSSFIVSHALKTFTQDEVVTQFRLTQEWIKT